MIGPERRKKPAVHPRSRSLLAISAASRVLPEPPSPSTKRNQDLWVAAFSPFHNLAYIVIAAIQTSNEFVVPTQDPRNVHLAVDDGVFERHEWKFRIGWRRAEYTTLSLNKNLSDITLNTNRKVARCVARSD